MSISKIYDPKSVEEKWYQYWLSKQFFKSTPDKRPPYSIVMPPPNVTGVLHMGHMLNNTIQDVLIRRARMRGYNACWTPGTDHASIATEAKVVALLKEKGIEKDQIGREEFLKYAWEWKEKYGNIILEQLKKLGASCDWDRTAFTMDPGLYEAVEDTFIHLYNKGLIYRGIRMVNWDPQGKTAISDEEVIRKETIQKLYFIKYQLVGEEGHVCIATTRPETIPADTGVCIHPKDQRYLHLHGKKVFVPLIHREIPIILDEYVDPEFGTGCLKVTPAHDINDYELGLKHGLSAIDILNEDGTLNEKAEIFVGEDRFSARIKIVKQIEETGGLEKIEEYNSQVGYSERTDAVVEPKLSLQWFCKMDQLAKPALESVLKGDIRLIPDKFINTYRHWMENVKDWCISRQLWWGQRIPAWYLPNGKYVVAKTKEEAYQLAKNLIPKEHSPLLMEQLSQDEDVLDTWFSSWLWPMSVFDPTIFKRPLNKGNADLQYYYPTNDLVTAPEILFFWVARMIISGYAFQGTFPFRNVYLTGIVRDKQGRKMSKSLGNSPDPLQLIEKYGADGVRMGMLLSSPAGNDLMFDEAHCEQGRNFANKIWNAFRLIKGWQINDNQEEEHQTALNWFENRFYEVLMEVNTHFEHYRLSNALMSLYKLVWDDFCSRFLEIIKPAYGDSLDRTTYERTLSLFENLLKLLHPFMPFITEELWHQITPRTDMDCITISLYPEEKKPDALLLKTGEATWNMISGIRNIRNAKQIKPKDMPALSIKVNSGLDYRPYIPIIKKLANISDLILIDSHASGGGFGFFVGSDECFLDLSTALNTDEEQNRINKDLKHLYNFLKSIDSKLQNERFMKNARPEVIQNEQKKKADTESKITSLEALLKDL